VQHFKKIDLCYVNKSKHITNINIMKATYKFLSALSFLALPFMGHAQCLFLQYQTSDFNGEQVSCNGYSDGSISVTPVGNYGPVSYLWSNGSTDATVSGLSAGFYTVSATDNSGCLVTETIQISEPSDINITSTRYTNAYGYDLKCFGDANARVSVLANGGTGKKYYNWSTGDTTTQLRNLSSGIYTLLVSDDNGCNAYSNILISEPTALTVSASVISGPTVVGATDAEAIATASGGTGTYSFEWSNGILGGELFNVGAGTYSVKATDAVGCSDRVILTIINPLNNTISTTPASTGGSRNGSRNISLTANQLRPVMPQLVTPNTAGFNSNFTIKNLENFQDTELTIFNMMGQQLASYKNYSNEWNGVNGNNEELTNGTYVAVLKYTVDGVTEVVTTQVVVAR
jgi:gliding motility-associated-like protein